MYRTSRKFALLLGFCLAASPVSSLEMTAGSSSPQNDLSGVTMRMEAMRAALESALNDILTCNNKQMAFSSNPPAGVTPDADGCIEIAAEVDTTKYEIVKGAKTVNFPQSCVGSGNNGGCSLSISLAPYVDKENLTFTASCRGANWCGGPSMGTVALPNLSSAFTNMTIVRHSGDKANGVRASWNPSTKILSLSSFYTGKSTERKRGGIDDLRLNYTTMELKEVK